MTDATSPFLRADAELLSDERLYDGFFSVRRLGFSVPRYDGGRMTMTRECLRIGEVVIGLPYDAARDEVLFVEQFRVGPWTLDDPDPWILEAVAGFIDKGETPEQAILREAKEEAGLRLGPGALVHQSSFYSSPGVVAERMHGFLLRADLSQAGGVHGVAHEHENIRVVALPFAMAMALAESGRLRAGPTLLLLYALALRRAEWRAA